jgi:hypothetical protein
MPCVVAAKFVGKLNTCKEQPAHLRHNNLQAVQWDPYWHLMQHLVRWLACCWC